MSHICIIIIEQYNNELKSTIKESKLTTKFFFLILVLTTLTGDNLKTTFQQGILEVKFVLDSYEIEKLNVYNLQFFKVKSGVLKRIPNVKFSFIGLRNEQ